MNLNAFRINSYYIEDLNADFLGTYAFKGNNRNFLLSDLGYSVLLDDVLLDSIKNKQINEELAIILIQHRFIKLLNYDNTVENISSDQNNNDINPVFFMIDLTNRCNMACKYCLRDGNDTLEPKVISSKKITQICNYIFHYCNSSNEDKITIQPWGGEPLLEKEKIFQIQDIMHKNNINPCISIETNGLLLTDEVIDELYKRNIWTSVSIDGPEYIHNNQRVFRNGKPTHSIVEKNLCKLRDVYAGKVSVIATLTKNSYKYVKEIIKYLVVDLKIENIKVNFVHKSTFVNNDDLCMSSEEIGRCTEDIFYTLMELSKEGYCAGDYNVYTKLMNLLYNRKTDVCLCNGCHGGRRMITFDYNGDIYPCDVTDYPEECMGNIKDDIELINMVEKAIHEKKYFVEKKEKICENCPWQCYCKGGCTVHVKAQGKTPPQVDEIECAVNRVLYPLMIDCILNNKEDINNFLQMEVL